MLSQTYLVFAVHENAKMDSKDIILYIYTLNNFILRLSILIIKVQSLFQNNDEIFLLTKLGRKK